jgi:hypothetical protein
MDSAGLSDEAGATPGPIIGTIDPDSVTLVEAEPAAPLMAICAVNPTREARVDATFPRDSIALSVTPDGQYWAYARPTPLTVLDSLDGGTPSDAGDQAAGFQDAGAAFEVVVDGAGGETHFTLPPEQAATLGVALSPDAQRLVSTRADQRGFVLWERSDAGEGFVQAAAQPFVRLNALSAQGGVRFERPVFSTSGTRLYVQEIHPGNGPLQLVLRDGQWESEQRLTGDPLLVAQFSVTAASADDLTVFGWSASEQRATGLWRPRADEPFESRTAFGDVPILGVSEDCNRWWTLR